MNQFHCLRCNEPMQYLACEDIQLGKTGWILGDLPNLLAGSMKVDLYICPKCRKLELYAAEESDKDNAIPTRTCPVCGTVHEFDYPKCPKCKHGY